MDLQNIVKSKHLSADDLTKIFKDLNGALSLSTIKRWVKTINETGAIKIRNPPGHPLTALTKVTVSQKSIRTLSIFLDKSI